MGKHLQPLFQHTGSFGSKVLEMGRDANGRHGPSALIHSHVLTVSSYATDVWDQLSCFLVYNGKQKLSNQQCN